MTREIIDILRSLGSTKAGKGRTRAVAVIALALEDEDRMQAIGKDIYQVVGEASGCKGSAVERNIRTISRNAWNYKKERLKALAGYYLDDPPSAKEFVDIISTHLRRKMAAQDQD